MKLSKKMIPCLFVRIVKPNYQRFGIDESCQYWENGLFISVLPAVRFWVYHTAKVFGWANKADLFFAMSDSFNYIFLLKFILMILCLSQM